VIKVFIIRTCYEVYVMLVAYLFDYMYKYAHIGGYVIIVHGTSIIHSFVIGYIIIIW